MQIGTREPDSGIKREGVGSGYPLSALSRLKADEGPQYVN